MRLLPILLSLYFFNIASISAYNNVVDSLKVSLKNEEIDSIKVEILQELAKEWYGENYDSVRLYASISLELSKKASYLKGKAEAYRIYGNSYELTRKPDSALFYYKKSLEVHNQISDSKRKIVLFSNFGSNYHRIGNLDSAAANYHKAIALAESSGLVSMVGNTIHNLGYIYEYWGNRLKALEYYHKSLAIRLEEGDESLIASSYSVIGGMYDLMNEHEKAIEYTQKARNLFKKNNRWIFYAYECVNLGVIYLSVKEYVIAKTYFLEAINYFKKDKDECNFPLAYINLSKTYYHTGILDSAFILNEKAGEYAIKCQSKRDQSGYYYQKGKILEKQNKITEAEKAFMITFRISEEIGRYSRKGDAAEYLYKIYKRKNNYKKALHYLEIHKSVKDSIFNEEKAVNITKLNAKFEYEKEKQQLVFEQEKEKLKLIEDKRVSETRQYAAFIGLFLALIIVVAIVRAYKIKQDSNKVLFKLNDQLAFANEKLKQLDQFKTRLFSNVNHDFRTPLTLIIGFISKISENKENYLTQESEEDLQLLEKSSLKLMEMTEEINDILLLEEGKLVLEYSQIELVSYLNRTVKMFTSAANKSNILLEYKSLVNNEVIANVDVLHFDKIIYNLIFNALRYTNPSGYVSVQLDNGVEGFEISIHDTGKGIDQEFLPFIFDRYYQAPNKARKSNYGFGVGLAVVKELINLHGGTISVTSEKENGTDFKILMPFNLDKPVKHSDKIEKNEDTNGLKLNASEAFNSMVGKERSSEKYTILIVDDQEEIRQFISSLIDKYYHVKNAANGNQALNILARDEIDLIITDLMMPWLDGFELIDKIKKDEKLKKIPIMVISARNTDEDKLNVLNKGVNNFVSKPFNPIELKKRIQNILSDEKNNGNSWDAIVENKNFLSTVEQNILKNLNQLILDRIDDPNLTIELIANELCASRSKTIKMIKSLTGKTPLAYIKSIRMDYVSHLIKTQKVKNVTEAAIAIGMKNATQFSNQFKKFYGEAPFELN